MVDIDKFGEQPPLMVMPTDPQEQLEAIQAAIDSGKPFDPYADDSVPKDAVF